MYFPKYRPYRAVEYKPAYRVDTIVSHIYVERALQTAFKLSRYQRHLDYFLLNIY